MGHSSSKTSIPPPPPTTTPSVATPTSFGRAKTMIDVTKAFGQAQGDNNSGSGATIQRSSSDTALNASNQTACQNSYQQSLEWGRNEQFLKLAHTFHTNNY